MKNIKFQFLKIICVIILLLLAYGACTAVSEKGTNEIYKEETYKCKKIVPEYYSDEQLAFIYWEDMYKYFITVDEAERCKAEITKYLLKNDSGKRIWVVKDVEASKIALLFKLVNNNSTYQVKINENNMLIYQE